VTRGITAQQNGAAGEWLRQQREGAGLTQEELAERAGLSVRTIRNLESGSGQPQLRSVRSLTAALGIPEAVMSQLIVAYRSGAAPAGRAGQGLPYCRRALGLYQQLSRPMLEAHAWDSLGFIEFQLGDPPAATISYQRAISLFQQVGEAYARAQSLDRLGDVQSASGHPRPAQASWQQALAILDELAPAEASPLRGKLRQAG
jgi:transcriptional regulator with XRE-family HTH domain